MSKIERHPILNREDWLAWRMRDITASDVPNVCGEGLYGSAASVWARKKGLIAPVAETNAMKKGRWAEAAVFEALADEVPRWEFRRAKMYLRDPIARLGCTPDGFASDPDQNGIGIVQAKVVMRPVFVRDWCAGCDDHDAPVTAPMAYQLQTLTEAMLSDAGWAVLAVLVHDTFNWQLRVVPVNRHAGAEAMIRERVAAFWTDYLDADVCPPIDPARDDNLVKALFPQDDGREVDMSTDNRILELVDRLTETKAAIRRLDRDQSIIETEIKAKLGSATYGRLPDGGVISWRSRHRAAYTVGPSSFRVLRVSRK